MRLAVYNQDTGVVDRIFITRDGEDFVRTGHQYVLPNGSRPSPLKLGWESGDWIVMEVIDMAIPADKRRVGDPTYQPVDGKLVETYSLEDLQDSSGPYLPLEAWEFHAMIQFLDKDADIRTAIGAIPDDLDRAEALKRYEVSRLYRRDDDLLAQLAVSIGMPSADIDAAWAQMISRRQQ